MSELSIDILQNLLSRLPAKDLFRLRAVCKLWKEIIEDPLFIKSHTKIQHPARTLLVLNSNGGRLFCLGLDRLNNADDGVQDIGMIPLTQLFHCGVSRLSLLPAPSCNGLILLWHRTINKAWAIWNPLTQDFHEVPPSSPLAESTGAQSEYGSLERSGMGYDETSNDYKVVRVDRWYREKGNNVYFRSLIYTLKSPWWRPMEGFLQGVCGGGRGVFLNGALHWKSERGIIVLHLGREKHRLMALPQPERYWKTWHSFDVMDGCLVWSSGHKSLLGMDVWVLKDYGGTEAWTKLVSVVQSEITTSLRVLAYMKGQGQLIVHDYQKQGVLKWIDLEGNSSREITILGLPHPCPELYFDQFSPGSLVRLDRTKKMARVKRKRSKATTEMAGEQAVYARFGEKVSVDCASSNCIKLGW